VTRWRDEASFEAWRTSPAFSHGHRQAGSAGPGPGQGAGSGSGSGQGEQGAAEPQRPVAVSSELWSFEVSGG
jgi:heme oxygenase (mycobilin-producing)